MREIRYKGNTRRATESHCFGKSFIFQVIPVIALLLWKKPCTVFIVSPPKALYGRSSSLGFKAVALNEEADDSVIERVMNGEYSHVYGSPESFLSQDKWRDVFTSNTFKEHLVGVAVDKAHCISHWYVQFDFVIYFPKNKNCLRAKSRVDVLNPKMD